MSGTFEQLIDQPGGFQLIELLDRLAPEALAGKVLDLFFIKPVFLDDLENQIPLFVRALPRPITIGMFWALGLGGSVGSASVGLSWNEPGVLDFLIHTLLESLVETGAFAQDVVVAADLGLDADRELMTGVPRRFE